MRGLGTSELAGFDPPLEGDDMAAARPGWPQEVRKLLFEANQEASRLRAERHTSLARANQLERRLEEATTTIAALNEKLASLERERRKPPLEPDAGPQRWLQDVTDRTASALRSGQEAARSLVTRAHAHAAEIEQSALRDAAAIRKRAEAQAAKVLSVAEYDAEGLLQGAQASAEELLNDARKQWEEFVAQLRRRAEGLQGEIARLEGQRVQLLETYAAIRRPVDEAVRILERGRGPGPEAAEPSLAGRLRDAYTARTKRLAARPERVQDVDAVRR